MVAIAERSRPAVGAAVDALRTHLRNAGSRAGDPLDSEHRLVQRLGASRGTVRRAIDILVASGELTRRPHSRPMVGMAPERSTVNEGLDVYVWVSHPISDNASLMFMKGVSLGLKGTPYRMIVREPTRFFGNHVPTEEREFFTGLLENDNAAGAIVQRDPFGQSGEIVEKLLQKGKPVVFVDSPPPEGVAADYVGSANLAAARKCVEYLIELGHRRIACLVDSDVSDAIRQRVKGYRRAMHQAGLDELAACVVAADLPAAEVHFRPSGPYSGRCATHGVYLEWSQRLVSAVLAMPERPTALFIGCDVLAHSVAALLEGAGISIPGEMSLVGFDWLARWEPAQLDDLTTASQDFDGFGRQAADLLLDRLSGEISPTPRHILLPAPLVVRSSTAHRTTFESPVYPRGDDALQKL